MLSWNPSIDNSNQPVTYHLYGSDTYPVDIRNPKNLITTYLPTNHYPYKPSQPWLLKRYLCVTAADRFGNESVPLELNKASEDDLPILNDGDQVTLPHVKDVRYIRIATPTGHEVLRIDYANSLPASAAPGYDGARWYPHRSGAGRPFPPTSRDGR